MIDGRLGRRAALRAALGASLLASSRAVRAASAGLSDALVVGMSTALTGPAEALGTSMRAGVAAYFDLVNGRGGVDGRMLRLEAVDDGYEPSRTAENVRRLIDDRHAFAILGNVGTPTAAVTVPIANEKKVPFFGAFTGAGLLRKVPPDRYVINFRASYAQETAEMVRGLLDDLHVPPSRIALFTQDDAYGDAGHAGAVKALKARGFDRAERLVYGRYPRNSTDVEDALARVLDPRVAPQAVIMVGAYAPCAQFIKLARKYGLRAIFANVSFVGSAALAAALGPDGDGVVVTQVVPHFESDLPVVRDYRAAFARTDYNFISLEGFIAARAFVEALTRSGFDRERFIEAIDSGVPFDLGLGRTHSLSPRNHQFSDQVWPTFLKGGTYAPMTSWSQNNGSRAR